MGLTIGLGDALTIGVVLLTSGVTIGTLRAGLGSFKAHLADDQRNFGGATQERERIRGELAEVRVAVGRLEGNRND